MVDIFEQVDRFFASLKGYDLNHNIVFILFLSLFILTVLFVIAFTSKAYESRLIKAIDMFNNYFLENAQINEENLVAFNNKMKSNKVPKQLRKQWQQFVLYREAKASHYMSFENCVSNPIKNSSFKRGVTIMNILAYVFAVCSLVLNAYVTLDSTNLVPIIQKIVLSPAIILLLNYIVTIFLNLRHSAIVSDLNQNYQYFEVNIDKATQTLPEYVDYEVLFDKNEIKRGIPILYAYLQKRAEEEQRELERARLKNVEHEKFNFDEAGVAGSLVLERAMQEAENYIAERKKFNQDTEQINSDITQEEMAYREITKEYNRQMQVSRETFANFKAQLDEASSAIEVNYIKKQQQQELDRQRNLERDFDTATERHKKILESYHAELDSVDKFRAESRKTLEDAMMSEFDTYGVKVYEEAKKLVEVREKEKYAKIQKQVKDLEEKLVVKNKELETAYNQNQLLNEKIEAFELSAIMPDVKDKKKKNKKEQEYQPVVQPEIPAEQEVQNYDAEPSYEDNYEEPVEFDEQLQAEEVVEDNYEDNYNDGYNDNVSENYEDEYEDNYDEYDSEYEQEVDESVNVSDESYDDSIEEGDTSIEELTDFSTSEYESEEQIENLETPAQPKRKAGRPKKEKVVSEEPKKGRGRPKKVIEATVESVSEVIRGRGRPKKVVAEQPVNEVKKGRGRPKKVVANQPNAEPKKGRGRPKKVEQPKPIVEEAKKGRGRPKKVITEQPVNEVKKGRGRPKKIAEVTATVESKKGRGRPKKVEQPKPIVEETKKGRGRPKKVVAEQPVNEVKKGRGRPKKVVENQQIAEPKKGRGRPKKQQVVDKNLKNIDDIDAYLKEIDDVIAKENAKLEESKKAFEKKARIKKSKK